MKYATDWQTYRTRFLVHARQLDAPLCFSDSLGREHCGDVGDYLVESSDGVMRIAPRELFEDIYVPMEAVRKKHPRGTAADHRNLNRTAMRPVLLSSSIKLSS